MRFPAPDRLNMRHISLLAAAIFVGQVLEGTDLLFSVLTAVYTLLWANAFNVAGGIRYPSGASSFSIDSFPSSLVWVSRSCSVSRVREISMCQMQPCFAIALVWQGCLSQRFYVVSCGTRADT